ncbi:MAG: hypothetical protein ACE5R4_18265 [Armatimonadota bacterium]
MRIAAAFTVVLALSLTSIALAEQVGGPSGPEKGDFRFGGEAIFRTNVGMDIISVLGGERVELKSRTYYGVLEYGITDCLSIRGKAGIAEWEQDAPPPRVAFDSGLAWAAGLRWRICKPEEHGTSLALSGQYAQTTPDDFQFPGVPIERLQNLETREWTAALTVGVPHGSARTYAGVVYSDLELDLEQYQEVVGAPDLLVPARGQKHPHVGAVVGIDHDLGGSGFWNLEVRGFDEEGVSGSINIVF